MLEPTDISIALDMDGVLAATKPRVFEYMGETVEPEDCTSWDWPIEQFGADRFLGAFHDVWTQEWESVEACEPDVQEISAILQQHFKLDVVTTQPNGKMPLIHKEAWLMDNGIIYDELVAVDRGTSKSTHGYDVYIDDKPSLPVEVNKADPDAEMVLMDHPYNRDAPGEYTRVQTLKEAMTFILYGKVLEEGEFPHEQRA